MESNRIFDDVNVRFTQKIGDIDIVMLKGEKGDAGELTDEQVATAVDEWLTEHPEATTTVQDGAITLPKLANDVRAEIDTKADAIVKTASGSIASFSDGGDELPMKSLKVNIVPKQDGSGDPSPSNVRPISGWDAVDVTRVGKNLVTDSIWDFSGISRRTGGTGATNLIQFINGLPSGSYTISFEAVVDNVGDSTKNWEFGFWGTTSFGNINSIINKTNPAVGSKYRPSVTINKPSGGTVDALYIYAASSSSGDLATISNWQLEVGSTATDYEPYEGETITTNLGQTVYGGVLDVVSGKLTIDKAMVDLGTLNWSGSSGTYYVGGSILWGSQSTDLIAEKYTASTSVVTNAMEVANGNLIVHSTETPTGKLVYRKATPTELTLTPTEVKSLLGNNNIWSESGTVEVEYRADTTLAYNELLNLIANM